MYKTLYDFSSLPILPTVKFVVCTNFSRLRQFLSIYKKSNKVFDLFYPPLIFYRIIESKRCQRCTKDHALKYATFYKVHLLFSDISCFKHLIATLYFFRKL